MGAFDLSSLFGLRVAERLQKEEVLWLTTVRRDNTPQPSPVWFWWDGATLLIYSQPNVPKLRNIAHNPTVALHFNSAADGDDIAVITGTARVDQAAPLSIALPDYIAKYRQGIAAINMTPESLSAEFSVAIRVTPQDLRGHV